MATDLANLQATRSALIQTLAAESAAQAAGGGKPTYTLDGETYAWSEWRTQAVAQIQLLTTLIQLEGGPYVITSRQRA